MTRRVTIEMARELFIRRGCLLLIDVINNVREKLPFTCVCGRLGSISYDKFRGGQLCSGCKGERAGDKTRHTIEFVRSAFVVKGCVLLSTEYSGNKQKLKYICECGTYAEIAFAKFQSGQRCRVCRSRKISEKLSGPNNHFWRADLTPEHRIKERCIPGYIEWRKGVYARDNYTCVSCGQRGGKLNAHHLESYARVPELRTEITNGVTLCKACHDEYHRKILHNDADIESFHYFMTDYRDPWYAGERHEEEAS